jgi:hypothetical protein
MTAFVAVRREVRHLGAVTLYFLGCFGIVLTLKKLFLADYHIEFYALTAAIVGALIASKLVLILDATRAGTRFDVRLPLAVAALYKTLIYMIAAGIVLFGERLFHAYRESGMLVQALADLWMHRDLNIILAKIICIGVAFAGYHLYAGLDRRLGEGNLLRLLTSRESDGK